MLSVSYGDAEAALNAAYVAAVDRELMKLGARGVTVAPAPATKLLQGGDKTCARSKRGCRCSLRHKRYQENFSDRFWIA